MPVGGLRKFGDVVRRRDQEAGDMVDPMLAPAANLGDDKLGAYPTQIRVPVLEGRRYLWTTRAFALGFYLSVILNIVMALLIYTILPLKRVEPFLVTFNEKTDQVVQVQPFIKNSNGFYLMTEKLAGEYVKMREEVIPDDQEMYRRWGEYLKNTTEENLFRDFVKDMTEPLKDLRATGTNIKVDVTRIDRRNESYVEVYFSKIGFDARGNEISRQQYIAQINFTYLPKTVAVGEQYINPLGFTVVGYNLRQN